MIKPASSARQRLLCGAGDLLLSLPRRVKLLPLLGEILLDVVQGGVETLAKDDLIALHIDQA